MRVLRPADAASVYAHPRPEFARLERQGALHRVAPGYYAVLPDHLVGQPWLPELEAVALGIAVAGGTVDDAALTGISAARLHGAIPRALGVAVVATHHHRRRILDLVDRNAQIVFVRRDLARTDLQRATTELGAGWVTSIEQTILDLAAHPELGGMSSEATAAALALLPRADQSMLGDLAARQRKTATLHRLLKEAGRA
ncbi:type IV toxin-antitoxin system AbiEi family antitoxin domain-containing protein [Actinopolymorpha pittospori]|uniref:Transcriptional regulator of viral defense system n=1 Tax=Actinopolymorpha pittospori TaxID=648752 RepID=A0A927R9X9_9ACTN|nr:type IV toxin-antitoxin system AbiEi family antitoxin [Actinopolymorpha pittospori]MBE1606994.1 putative transcriptional regulator of viral defense system [Actinopolymorpha pittospori]